MQRAALRTATQIQIAASRDKRLHNTGPPCVPLRPPACIFRLLPCCTHLNPSYTFEIKCSLGMPPVQDKEIDFMADLTVQALMHQAKL